MKTSVFIIVICVQFASCGQKKMTLDDLLEAKWINLTQGIDYISIQDGTRKISEKDSLSVVLKGMSVDGVKTIGINLEKQAPEINSTITEIIKQQNLASNTGYLRINLYDMLRPAFLKGIIYLKGDYKETFSFKKDSLALKNISGIKSVLFISKEDAKKKYIGDGNGDWSKVLDENPLPNSIEITLEKTDWTSELLSELKSRIMEKIALASEFIFPSALIQESKKYYYFEYKVI